MKHDKWTIKIDDSFVEYTYILSGGERYSIQDIIDGILFAHDMTIVKEKQSRYKKPKRKPRKVNGK